MFSSRAVLAALLACALGVAAAPAASAAPKPSPVPVVYDGDSDFADIATLAYLCQAHKQRRIDLRAVTVTNNGAGIPGRALTHVRTALGKCGLSGIPVADGSDTGVNPMPADGRAWTESILNGALGDANVPSRPSHVKASALLAATVLKSSKPVVVIATGPLTNVAKALDVPGVAQRISRLAVMGGAFDVPGNLFGPGAEEFDGTQEVNMWLDPASADKVFAGIPRGRVDIVGLDATNDVPITPSYVERLGREGRTTEAKLVHAIVTQPDLTPAVQDGSAYWWDTLASSEVFDAVSPVKLRPAKVDVRQDGAAAGRTYVSPEGTPQNVGYDADPAAYENGFLKMLNG
ncbi:nucleoside hydrolase [Amycolatopsis pittospori]|uniref:nucleoside hydrolase n=1 Tax=Amycolatopsis pittospori TaxID=2749434 RepID=UPI0015F0FD91|nr:nucleoside hydrolase [Amycolatopsis pittospori]